MSDDLVCIVAQCRKGLNSDNNFQYRLKNGEVLCKAFRAGELYCDYCERASNDLFYCNRLDYKIVKGVVR